MKTDYLLCTIAGIAGILVGLTSFALVAFFFAMIP